MQEKDACWPRRINFFEKKFDKIKESVYNDFG